VCTLLSVVVYLQFCSFVWLANGCRTVPSVLPLAPLTMEPGNSPHWILCMAAK
jgi:hypothetical protein